MSGEFNREADLTRGADLVNEKISGALIHLCVISAFLCVSAVYMFFCFFYRRGAEERRDYAEKI